MRTINHINDITNAFLVLVPFFLTLRAVRDGMNAYEEDMGLKVMLTKIKKRVFAAIIAITVSSIVAFIKSFYI